MINNEILVSIIIPIFNAESYIDRCLKSILNNNIKNIEIILVNDGSVDRSGEICEKYKCNYENIIYINQCNQGPSVARNNGIKHARGKYISFIDIDDEVKDNFIETIIKEIDKEDIELFMWGIEYQWINKNLIIKMETDKYDTKEYSIDDFATEISRYLNRYYFNFVWNKLYKRDVIIKNDIKFDKRFQRSEDLLFNLEYIKYIKDVKVLEDILYIHKNTNKESITQTYDSNQYENEKVIYVKMKETIEKLKCNNDYNVKNVDKYFIDMSFSILSYLINRDYGLSYNEKREAGIKIIKDNELNLVLQKNKNNRKLNKILYFIIKNNSFILLYIFCKSIRTYQKYLCK